MCLPTNNSVAGVENLNRWAIRADELGFSSLGVMDKIAGATLEPLIVLSAMSSITKKIRLLTGVLVLPVRDTSILANQAASIDVISNGRLTLGVAVGSRIADYEVVGKEFNTRGKIFEKQLATIRSVWNTSAEDPRRSGPKPVQKSGPELLIGGRSGFVPRRIANWGDGYISPSHADAREIKLAFKEIYEAWSRNGRDSEPRLVCTSYYSFESSKSNKSESYLREMYSHRPSSENQSRNVLETEEDIRKAIDLYKSIGANELVFRPILSDIRQLELLAESTDGLR